jgi:hypothetical protein
MRAKGGSDMASVEVSTDDFEKVGDFFWLRVGMIFRNGEGPQNAQGMIRHRSPAGAKWNKFYFPSMGADLLNDRVDYSPPRSMEKAEFGELVLKRRGNWNSTNQEIVFGRFGEDKPFGFGDSSYVNLRISRLEDRSFSSLYMRLRKDEELLDRMLLVQWANGNIALSLYPVDENEVPPFLKEVE